MQYVLTKNPDGTWQAALHLPRGDGTLSSVAQGITKAEATVKAARVAVSHGQAPNKAKAIAALAKAAALPMVRDLLKTQGLAAAEAAASAIPGGGAVVAALKLAAKYGPAKRLLGRLIS